jgi:hypothetical protein
MRRNLKAATGYFAIVFAAGFLTGVLRVVAVMPHVGEETAVLIELPLMLAISWLACRWMVEQFALPHALTARLFMGSVAFGLLMAAEIGVSVLAFGRTVSQHVETYQKAAAIWGLAAQIAFALFPVIQMVQRREGKLHDKARQSGDRAPGPGPGDLL